MGGQLGTRQALTEINMTPLIDIVLVVLIIMMVNIPIQIEQMGIKLPSDVQVQRDNEPPPDQLVIAVYEDGKVALNRELMEEDKVFFEVTRRLRSMAKKNVFIDAHPETGYGIVVDWMDLAREAGANKVALARLKEDGPAEPTGAASGALERGVYPGSPHIAGVMSEKKADAQFKPLLPKIRQCYATALARNPTLSGRVVVGVDVGPEGQVMDSKLVSTSAEDDELIECILSYLPALVFEPLGEQNTARVHFPYMLSAG